MTFPMNIMVMFHSYVKLPEGNSYENPIKPPFSYGFPMAQRPSPPCPAVFFWLSGQRSSTKNAAESPRTKRLAADLPTLFLLVLEDHDSYRFIVEDNDAVNLWLMYA